MTMPHGYHENIEELTLNNAAFRHVLYTSKYLQLVLMTLPPGTDIGAEVHPANDQFFRFEAGEGKIIINDVAYHVTDGHVIIVPAGARHNVINTSTTSDLKLYTLYAPPHHLDGIKRDTKAEAEADGPEFDGRTTE